MDMALGVLRHEQQYIPYQTPNKPQFKPVRGEIYFANVQITKENTVIQKGARPIVILSCEETNESAGFVNYVPLSSNIKRTNLPTHILISYESGLKKPSIAIAEQPNLIDKEDLQFRIGKCPDYIMERIDEAVRGQLGLDLKVEKEIIDDNEHKALIVLEGLLQSINSLNEVIYDLNDGTSNILKLRLNKVLVTKNFCLQNDLDFKSSIKKVKYYDKMIADMKNNK